jgi:hypothetical protein
VTSSDGRMKQSSSLPRRKKAASKSSMTRMTPPQRFSHIFGSGATA